jgi:hypothetical protein
LNTKGSSSKVSKTNTGGENNIAQASIVNIYIPDYQLGGQEDAILVGYHFENTHFVISSIISSSEIDNLESLSNLLKQTPKL